MDSGHAALTVWSYGLVGAAYLGFALRLLQLGVLRAPRDLPRAMLFSAVASCSLWGWLILAFLYTGHATFLLAGDLADLLRYGCWFAFLLLLLRPRETGKVSAGTGRLGVTAIALVCFGVVVRCFGALDIGVLRSEEVV